MRTIILLGVWLLGSGLLQGQTGVIKGKVQDSTSGDGVSFANVQLERNGNALFKTLADLDGNFMMKAIPPGKYDLKADAVGYAVLMVSGVIIEPDSNTYQVLTLSRSADLMEILIIADYSVPLISPDTKSGCTVTREEFSAMPSKNINSVACMVPGVSRRGVLTRFRGSRSDAQSGVTATGGVPASYGDGSGGFLKFNRKDRRNHAANFNADLKSESYNRIYENEFLQVRRDAVSTFSIDVDKASYSNMRRFLQRGVMPPPDAVRIEELINYFPYDYSAPAEGEPFSVQMEMGECPWNSAHQLLRIGLYGKKIELDKAAPGNFVFLIDVSGSMSSEDKLPLLVSSFKLLVEQLRPEDRIAIVVYAGAAGLVLPSTPGSDKATIYAALESLESGGSTAGGAGIELAYETARKNFIKDGNNRVILATDGDFNVGISDEGALVRLIEQKREQGVFLTVLGFGTGNYKDAKMEQLADNGNGNYFYIDNLMEGRKVLVKELGGNMFTIAKDVKLQLEFNPAYVKSYRLIGYENRMLAAEDFNDDRKDAGEIGSGHAVTALYEIIPAGSADDARPVDSLKYQKMIPLGLGSSKEVLTLKLRYKEPDSNESKLLIRQLNSENPMAPSSEFLFASSVAEFGLLLRNSKFKGTASYVSVAARARLSKGSDHDGYRAEFIQLVELAAGMDKSLGTSE